MIPVGTRIAIAGMGVSGQAVAQAAVVRGLQPTVFDERPNDSAEGGRAVDRLDGLGVPVVSAWHGRLDTSAFDLLVVSPGFPNEHPAVRDMRGAGREVWGEIEFAFRIAAAPILAITGTNGKSTTSVLAWTLLNACGAKARLCGNISGSGYPEAALSAAASEAGADEILVAEVSSYQLAFAPTFRPRVATITNITPDHMDRYSGFDTYLEAKLNLFAAMSDGDSVVVNLDAVSPTLAEARDATGVGVAFCPVSPSGREQASGEVRREGETLVLGPFSVPIADLPFHGEHDVANAMVAWQCASLLAPLDSASVSAMLEFRGLAHRMELLGERDGVIVINNSMCTNPAALIASSSSSPRPQRLLIGGGTKRLDFKQVGEYLRSSGHHAYLFGPDLETWRGMVGEQWPSFDRMEHAFAAAVMDARPGEAVLLCPGGASAEPYSNFRVRGDAFREMAAAWLGGGA